jgi:hypothetical protein
MHPQQHLSKFLDEVCNFMHATRRESLRSILGSCLSSESLGVTALGRGINRGALEKHRIKQADRLLSNRHLQQELEQIYRNLAQMVMNSVKRPVVLIDWSNLDQNERHFLLRASVPTKGRSITIYEEVHTKQTKERLATHKKFLKNLAQIIPQEAKPILVTDAGFRVTWFKAVRRRGWDWVGRIRGRMKVKLDPSARWIDGRALHAKATKIAVDQNNSQIAQRNTLSCRLVLYKAKPKGRVMRTKLGQRSTRNRAVRGERANREPLLLATSLPAQHYDAQNIVKLYSSRMQIEESFRDMKSYQYGLGLKNARTYKTKRMSVLVAIAALANVFSWIIGKATENKCFHRHFQANTIRTSTVLSYVFLGLKFFKQRRITLCRNAFLDACQQLPMFVRSICFV